MDNHNQYGFVSFFLILVPFIYFSCLTTPCPPVQCGKEVVISLGFFFSPVLMGMI